MDPLLKENVQISKVISEVQSALQVNVSYCSVCLRLCLQGLEGEDEGAISMLSDNTAKLTSAVRY